MHLAVDASRVFGEGRASGVVNAVLRRFVAQRAELLAAVDAELAQRHAHPRWLVEALTRPGANAPRRSSRPTTSIRPWCCASIRRSCTSRISCARGARSDARRAPSTGTPRRWCWSGPLPCRSCPGSKRARCRCRTRGAQLAAPLLDAQPGMRVLDACAAPGGKTLHIAQRTPALAELVAVDDDAAAAGARARKSRARAGARRCWSRPTCARAPPSLAAGSFDRVLVDAPCSATGVIRRHPDIKLLRRPSDIEALRRDPAADSRHRFRTTEARRPSHLLHLLGAAGGKRRRWSRRSWRRTARRAGGWPEGLARPPGLLDGRWAGSCCPVGARAPMASTMLACTKLSTGNQRNECSSGARITS